MAWKEGGADDSVSTPEVPVMNELVLLREPVQVHKKRGGPGTGWANPDADHHVYEYTSDPRPDAPVWAQGLRPKHRKMFITRSGIPLIVPDNATQDEINTARDQFTPGIVPIADCGIYIIPEEPGPPYTLETEGDVARKPYRLLQHPWQLIPVDEVLPKGRGKAPVIARMSDLTQLSQDDLLEIFRMTMKPERAKQYSFRNKKLAVEYTWNIWSRVVSTIGPGAKAAGAEKSHEKGKGHTPSPSRARVIKEGEGGKRIHRLPKGLSATRKSGTRRTESWAIIKDGMTVEAYVEAGGHMEDLKIMERLSHITFR